VTRPSSGGVGPLRHLDSRRTTGTIRRRVATELGVVNLLEALYALVAVFAFVTALAWVQSRAPDERSTRYTRRFRRFGWLTIGSAAVREIAVKGLLFGLAPALQSGRAQVVSALKEGGRGTSGGASLPAERRLLPGGRRVRLSP
jgi:hypothetical protein